MKKKSVIGLGILVFMLILPVFPFTGSQVSSSSFPFEIPKPSIDWDLSNYHNYTGAPIDINGFTYTRVYINGSDPLYNWTYWLVYPWLTGSGTEGDPYIIEKLLIDANDFGACLYIYDSQADFIIRQCYFSNTGELEYDIGIYFKNAENGKIYGNIIDYCKTGFYISYGCSNISIYRNFMRTTKASFGAMRAFYSGGAANCSFNKNLIFNYEELVTMYNSENVSINGNFMNNTEYDEYPNDVVGIIACSRIKFRENIFTDNFKWFEFSVDQVDCANNTIAGNSVINDLSNVEIPTPLSVGPPTQLHTAQSSGSVVGLDSTTNSQVVNNHIYQPGGALIPGFHLFISLGVIGVMGILMVLYVLQKQRKIF